MTPVTVSRFWAKVTKGWPDGCWLWSGSISHGYGSFKVEKTERAHRVSWELHNGPIPDGLWVLHKCDEPSCVNPQHLFLGTHAENMTDAAAKGRMPGRPHIRGVRSSRRAILSEQDVHAIRRELAIGQNRASIARRFGVSWSQVTNIYLGRSWGWLAEEAST